MCISDLFSLFQIFTGHGKNESSFAGFFHTTSSLDPVCTQFVRGQGSVSLTPKWAPSTVKPPYWEVHGGAVNSFIALTSNDK